MVVLGLILLLLGIAVGAGAIWVALSDPTAETTVEIFNNTLTVAPLTLVILGAASILLALLGLWLMAASGRRRMKAGKERRDLEKKQRQQEKELAETRSKLGQKESRPAREETSTAPRREEPAARRDDRAPLREESAPRRDDRAPLRDDSAPRRDDRAPLRDDSAPRDTGSRGATNADGVPPVDRPRE